MSAWRRHRFLVLATACSALQAASLVSPANTEESAVHAGSAPGSSTLVVLADTSQASLVRRPARPPFEPAAWAGRHGCAAGRIYWRRGGGPPPACDSPQWVAASSSSPVLGQRCRAAEPQLAARGWAGMAALAQWSVVQRRWRRPTPGAREALECEQDAEAHGGGSGVEHAADGENQPWTTRRTESLDWAEHRGAYTLYTAAYVAWWHHAPRELPLERRAMQHAAVEALAATWPGSLAVLRHAWNGDGLDDASAEGGAVIAIREGARAVRAPPATHPLAGQPFGGAAPLAESLYEAAAYLAGMPVDYGLAATAPPGTPRPSIRSSRSPSEPSRYASPLRHACDRATVLAFASTEPSADASAPPRIGRLARSLAAAPGSTRDSAFACGGPASSTCPGPLAALVESADLSPLPGAQSASVDWIALDAPAAWIDSVAALGGRRVPGAPDALPSTLVALAADRYAASPLAAPWTTAHQVGGAAAARDSVYVATFVPARKHRWTGDVRHHRLLRGVDGAPQVAEFAAGAVPTSDAPSGGTAFGSLLPGRDARRLYTDVGGRELTDARNSLAPGNAALDSHRLGLSATGLDSRATERARRELLQWMRGADVDDVDADGDRAEPRRELGAFRTAPRVLEAVGGERTVFAGSADGLLHAFDGTGAERWAYVPGVLLPTLGALREGATTGRRLDGLGGELRLHLAGDDGDGRLDAARGERALLFFGLRRGARAYVALDVTHPARPRHLWTLTPRELPALGQTWPAPVPARLRLADAGQHPSGLVVLLAGGYAPALDRDEARARDRLGASLHLVDGWTGRRLWSASGKAVEPAEPFEPAVPQLVVPGLRYAIAATPRAVDLDGDGELDLAYVADTGGQLWRFAFERGAGAGVTARATRIATLGGAGAADRRLHAEPDVAAVLRGPGAPYLAITLGSGTAADPLGLQRADRLYSIREPLDAHGRPRDPHAPVTDAELPEAGARPLPAEARGWKRTLQRPGEKILVPALTLDHVAYVPSWVPPLEPLGPDCTRGPGTSRLHAIDVRDGLTLDARRAREGTERPGATETAESDSATPLDWQVVGGPLPALVLAVIGPPEACAAGCTQRALGLVGTAPVP
ncbi:MAG: hypothetical protein ACK52I_23010, partial [Pseudomonadota bacterium]